MEEKIATGEEIYNWFINCAKENRKIKIKSIKKDDKNEGNYIIDLGNIIMYSGASNDAQFMEIYNGTINRFQEGWKKQEIKK